jgi:hypothetical protein
MTKKTPKLLFSKSKTIDNNLNVFEKYVMQLDKDFGNILLQNIEKSPDEIRDTTKEAINEFILRRISNE